MLGCFVAIGALILYVHTIGEINDTTRSVAGAILLLMVTAAAGWTIADISPTVRDLARLDVYAYQVRQLEAEHDLRHAEDLGRFGLHSLNLTEKWLGLRIERAKLRIGMYAGGSDKVAVMAVVVGAWSLWSGFPDAGDAVEQYLYLGFGAFLCGTGIGGMLSNRVIARMSYQRDLLALAICHLMNQ